MIITKEMTIGEFAALVASYLRSHGISTVLTGGAVVSIYTDNKYMSYDADFISSDDHKKIIEVMKELGFDKQGKDFRHPNSNFFVEFPTGPLAIGGQSIKAEAELVFNGNKLILLSPTQSVMDRLAAYFYWNDRQSLDQALMIAQNHPVHIGKIRKWALAEGEEEKFKTFLEKMKAKNKTTKRKRG